MKKFSRSMKIHCRPTEQAPHRGVQLVVLWVLGWRLAVWVVNLGNDPHDALLVLDPAGFAVLHRHPRTFLRHRPGEYPTLWLAVLYAVAVLECGPSSYGLPNPLLSVLCPNLTPCEPSSIIASTSNRFSSLILAT